MPLPGALTRPTRGTAPVGGASTAAPTVTLESVERVEPTFERQIHLAQRSETGCQLAGPLLVEVTDACHHGEAHVYQG